MAFIESLKGTDCQRCGREFYPDELQFHHHSGPKVAAVGTMVSYSREKIRAEASKCDVLCQGCHTQTHGKAFFRACAQKK